MIKTPFPGKKYICYSRILSETSGDFLKMPFGGGKKNLSFIMAFMHLITFILTWIIVLVSSNGIQVEEQYLKVTKTTSLLIFAPINTIFALPYIGSIFNKYKQKRLSQENIKSRLIITSIILLIVFIIETNYIKSFELGLLRNVLK